MSLACMMWRLRILTMEECIHHRPGRFGGGAGKYALAAGQGGFIAGGAVGFTGLKDKGGLAVEAYVFGDAQVGEEREGDGRCDMRSRRRRLAEIGKGTDYIEVAVFTGDFIEGHGGRLKTPFSGFRRPLAFVGS